MATVSAEDLHSIYASLHRAAQLAREARKRVEGAVFTEGRIEAEVLAEYAPEPAEPFRRASGLLRAWDSVATASDSTWGGLKSGASAVAGLAGSLQDGMSGTVARAAAVPALAANFQRTMSGTLSDTIAAPVAVRLKATGRALGQGPVPGRGLAWPQAFSARRCCR